MGGTLLGGKEAAKTNKALFGDDWYKTIGALGGKKSRTGGFFVNRELARVAGRLGGSMSRRSNHEGKKNDLHPRKAAQARKKFQQEYERLLAINDQARKERTM